MEKHNEVSLVMRLQSFIMRLRYFVTLSWSFICEWTRTAFFFVFVLFALQWWASFLVGAISLLACYYAYDFGQAEVIGIGIAMILFAAVYWGQTSEIEAYRSTKKRLRWHTPVTDFLFVLFAVILYTLTVRMGKDMRLFTPFIPQMVLHVIGFFAKRRVGRFIDIFY